MQLLTQKKTEPTTLGDLMPSYETMHTANPPKAYYIHFKTSAHYDANCILLGQQRRTPQTTQGWGRFNHPHYASVHSLYRRVREAYKDCERSKPSSLSISPRPLRSSRLLWRIVTANCATTETGDADGCAARERIAIRCSQREQEQRGSPFHAFNAHSMKFTRARKTRIGPGSQWRPLHYK